MIDILALLKRIEWKGVSATDMCVGCGRDKYEDHEPDCQLKAAIDALESLALVVVETGLDEA
jgi:hypothetical protein